MTRRDQLINRLNSFSKTIIFLIFGVIIVLAMTSCIRFVGFEGSGTIKSEDRPISGVNSVSVSSGMNLYLEQADFEKMTLEAEDNILPLIVAEVSDGNLTVEYKRTLFGGIFARKPVNIYLRLIDLDKIQLSSGSKLESSLIKTESLEIDLDSGSSGTIELDVGDLIVEISSGSNLSAMGNAEEQDISLSSGSAYKGEDLISSTAKVNASSGSAATINVTDSMDINISSGSRVEYYGRPRVTSNISSGGSLESKSEDQ
jgi:hypothetical protein